MAATDTVEVATYQLPAFPVRAQSKQYPAPEEMRAESRWVVWRSEIHEGKLKKVPFCARTDERADITDPSTWCCYAEALAAVERYDGLGFVLGDRWIGVDLDGCRDPQTGAIEPWAVVIVEALDSYTEISPSGTGLHVIGRGTLPEGRRRAGRVEMYDNGRYFTVTGRHVEGTPKTVEERTDALATLHHNIFGEGPGNHHRTDHPDGQRDIPDEQRRAASKAIPNDFTNQQLVAKARAARNGAAFWRLFDDGHWQARYPSQSEADQALAFLLAFWAGGEAPRVERLFSASALGRRPKWQRRRDYRERTIAKAIDAVPAFYVPCAHPPRPRVIRALLRADLSPGGGYRRRTVGVAGAGRAGSP